MQLSVLLFLGTTPRMRSTRKLFINQINQKQVKIKQGMLKSQNPVLSLVHAHLSSLLGSSGSGGGSGGGSTAEERGDQLANPQEDVANVSP